MLVDESQSTDMSARALADAYDRTLETHGFFSPDQPSPIEGEHIQRKKVFILNPDRTSDIAAIRIFQGGVGDPHVSISVIPRNWDRFHKKIETSGVFGNKGSGSAEDRYSPQSQFVIAHLKQHAEVGALPNTFSSTILCTDSANPTMQGYELLQPFSEVANKIEGNHLLGGDPQMQHLLLGVMRQAMDNSKTLDLSDINDQLDYYAKQHVQSPAFKK